MTATITMPEVPVLGLPADEKDTGQRVDFKPTKFDVLIETKGYMLAWTRACACPCAPVSTKTTEPDPNCSLCEGKGWVYFGGNQTQDLSKFIFDPVQQKIVDDTNPMLIRGILTGVMNQYNPMDRLGNWQSGMLQATVRAGNKLALYDKLVVLDSEIAYSEIIEADGTNFLDSRYRVTGVNLVRSAATVYTADDDYQLNSDGQIEWLAGKAPDNKTRIAAHYLCHPTFLVWEQPHVVRSTLKKFKTPVDMLKTPMGDAIQLPIQAIVRYDFIP